MSEANQEEVTDIVKERIENAVDETEDVQEVSVVAGYTVGLQDNGGFIFQIHGDEPNLIELLGLHAYASMKVEKIHSSKHTGGDNLTLEVGQLLVELDKKVTALAQELQKVLPKKPENLL